MTTTPAPAATAIRAACHAAGLHADDMVPVRRHATSVYLLQREGVIVRASPAARYDSITTSIALTRWLAEQGFPTVEPLNMPQPTLHHADLVVTFWRHYPQEDRTPPPAACLGKLLRALHALPGPPIALPAFRPLTSLAQTVPASTYLTSVDKQFLMERISELTRAYDALDSPLGVGLIHGDAYPGNTLWDDTEPIGVRLGDWDEAAIGPREVDLANTFQGARFGRSPSHMRAFTDAYGHDPRRWHGLSVLIRIRDLHTLGSFIRRADAGDPDAGQELAHRLATLKSDNAEAQWHVF
ncbi:phosphotransferase [Streptomyces mobaraensis]|uniref:Phosphotransferase n=2 Tax=Streptomyces mobaraensis TaxID=35621 RepID=A0A5N5W144_STRMB|nr:phosphotransferase [Streptomyces mobaraensis]